MHFLPRASACVLLTNCHSSFWFSFAPFLPLLFVVIVPHLVCHSVQVCVMNYPCLHVYLSSLGSIQCCWVSSVYGCVTLLSLCGLSVWIYERLPIYLHLRVRVWSSYTTRDRRSDPEVITPCVIFSISRVLCVHFSPLFSHHGQSFHSATVPWAGKSIPQGSGGFPVFSPSYKLSGQLLMLMLTWTPPPRSSFLGRDLKGASLTWSGYWYPVDHLWPLNQLISWWWHPRHS